MSAHKLTNGNCYLEGNKLVGKTSEVNFPDLKYKMTDFKSLGMLGDMEIPVGYEKMEAKVKFNTFLYTEFTKSASFDKPINLVFRGNQEIHDGNGISNENVTITLTGIAKNFPMGSFKANELLDLEITFAVYSAKVVVAGQPLMEYDVHSNTFKVGGRDMNAAWKLNT